MGLLPRHEGTYALEESQTRLQAISLLWRAQDTCHSDPDVALGLLASLHTLPSSIELFPDVDLSTLDLWSDDPIEATLALIRDLPSLSEEPSPLPCRLSRSTRSPTSAPRPGASSRGSSSSSVVPTRR